MTYEQGQEIIGLLGKILGELQDIFHRIPQKDTW